MALLDVRVLGPVEVLRAGRRVPLSPKERDLVALLVAHSPAPVAADRIEDELWTGAPPATARKVVQKYVSQLRASLGARHITWSHDGYALRDVSVDAVAFARAVEDAGHGDARETAVVIDAALASWRGEPYAGVDLAAVEPDRTRLAELRLAAIQRHVEAELTLGHHATLVGRLELLVAEHPLCEGLWGQLIRALYGVGRPSDALRAYRRLRGRLAEELGVDPSPALQALERLVLDHDPTLTVPAGCPGRAEQRRELTVVAVAVESTDDDPEDRARAARRHLATVTQIGAELGGTVESVTGGRIVVRFGDPAFGDDADRGVRAAHRIVAELDNARAGVATGWALVDPEAPLGTRVVGAVVDAAWAGAETAAAGSVVVDPSSKVAGVSTRPHLPFVGRAGDLAVLDGLISRTLLGHGPELVSVVGEAGVGKTRLLIELERRSPEQLRWLAVECVAGGADPLRALAGDDLLDELVVAAEEREWLRAVIGDGIAAERSEVVAAGTTLLAALAREQPTALVFEDAHRTDAAFGALLADCVDQLGDVPLLVLTTARPASRPPTGREMTLRGLAPHEIEGLLGHLLPDDAVNVVQRRALARRAAGNPLYAIQFAQMMEQREWDGSIPATVRALIAARLDLLAAADADVIVAGSVLGPSFDGGELADVLGVDEPDTVGSVRRLLATGLVERAPGNRLRLCHDLVRDVAYERLPRAARARLHQAAAASIERRAGTRLPRHAMRVSHHVGTAAQAIEDEGGDASALRRRAFDLIVLAGDSLEDAPPTGGCPPGAGHAERDRIRAEALWRRGELRRAGETAQRGLAAATAAGDRTAQARLHALIGNLHWLAGDTGACVAALESARALVAELEPGRPLLDAIGNLAFVTALLGRTGDAIELAEQGLHLAREHDAVDQEVRCLNARGSARLLEGDLTGYHDFTTALARALERGLSHESAMAYNNLAELHWQGEGPAAGLELNRKGLELAGRRGLAVATDWLRANRVAMCVDAGEWDTALDVAGIVLSQETSSGEGQAGTMCAVSAARIHVWRGELEAAQRFRAFFLPRARRHAVTQQLGPALVVAGLVETAAGDAGRGADLAAEFCALTERTREYRHMELADVVRLLLADGRVDAAVAAADSRVIDTVRNRCQSATAAAALAAARGEPDARARFERAADEWCSFGQPLEAYLGWRATGSRRADPERLGVDPAVADLLTPGCRPVRV